MKKIAIAILLLIIVFVFLRLKPVQLGDYLVKINNYTITPEEFDTEFLASAYAQNDTPESRKAFLDTLIQRKLVIQYAQEIGLDKNKEFLKSIERFWEQTLLKLVMDKKFQDVTGSADISDRAIEEEYDRLKEQGQADRPYNQMYSQIKWSLSQAKESEAVSKWLESLYKEAEIKINPAYSFYK